MEQNHWEGLDGLRAFAALGIVLMHVRANGAYEVPGFFYNTVIPSLTDFVFLFMAVSAFGLCCGYYERMCSGQIRMPVFYARRLQRLLPFFAVMVLLDIAVSPSRSALIEGFADLTLFHGLLPDPGAISVIGVGWFVGVTFVFYLCFPFFCYLLETRRRAWLAMAAAVLWNLAAVYYFQVRRTSFLYSGCYFLAGGLLYLYRREIAAVPALVWEVLAAAAVGLYYAVGGGSMPCLLVSAMLLAVGITCRSRLLCNPLTRFFSGISYEVYLSHMMVFRVLEKLHLTTLLGRGAASYVLTALLVLAGASVFSFAVQRLLRAAAHALQVRRGTAEGVKR